MEIKLYYNGEEVGKINVDVQYAIYLFAEQGFRSFYFKSKISKYDYFAKFTNEDTDQSIYFFPDKSFETLCSSRISYNLLNVIMRFIDNFNCIYKNIEESEKHEKESE